MSGMRSPCPHCKHPARIRTSKQISDVYRELWLECTNPQCGWRGKGGLGIIHTLSPSATPNPEVSIPLAPSLLAQLLPETN